VYVTDNVEGIVPEFLMMLRGVVDSQIFLNVFVQIASRWCCEKNFKLHYLKVADKLKSFTENRADFEAKWNDIKF
jgi:molecular chaperone HtpG